MKEVKWFFEKYTHFKVPSESHARKNIASAIYEESLKDVRDELKNDKIYVSIDETTDSAGRKIAACIVGSLNKPESGPFLINLEILDEGSADHLCNFLVNSLDLLYEGTGNIHTE